MLTIGIDPGKSGALAVLDSDGAIFDILDMPSDLTGAALGGWVAHLVDDLAPLTVRTVFVERVWGRPRQQGMWGFAEGFGALLGAFGALRIPTHLVLPKEWKATQGCMVPRSVPKEQRPRAGKTLSRETAALRWPAEADRFARVRDDGRADAAHIAAHGQGLF